MCAREAGDRVTELYRGEIFTPESQAICRNRVHWICSKAAGRRVLDAGCSQGIVSILLAQDGMDVLGVDLDADAIAFARAERERLPSEIRERVEFLCGDLRRLDPRELGTFDSIVLGEILEHFTQPEKLLDSVLRFASAEARLIVTVPFGVHPHPSHRSTFTLTRFIEMISGRLAPEELDVAEGYIRFVGSRRSAGTTGASPDLGASSLLALTEKGLVSSQARLFDQLAAVQGRMEELTKRSKAWQERAKRAEAAQQAASAASSAGDRSADELVEVKEQLRRLRVSLDESEAARERLERWRAELERALSARSELLERKQKSLQEAHQNLAEVRGRIGTLELEMASLRSSASYRIGRRLAQTPRSPVGLARLGISVARLLARGVLRRIRARLKPPLAAATLKSRAEAILVERGHFAAEAWAQRMVEEGRISEVAASKVLFSLLKDCHGEAALRHGERALALEPGNRRLARALASRHQRMGNVQRADELKLQALEQIDDPVRAEGELTFQQVKEKLQQVLETGGPQAVDEWCEVAVERGWASELKVNQIAFALTRRSHAAAALRYAERGFELGGDPELGQALLSQYCSLGHLRRAVDLALCLEATAVSRKTEFLQGQLRLLDSGFPPPRTALRTLDPHPDRVLYLLHNSLPHTSGGYATRSHGLALALRRSGVDLRPVTRLGFPLDLKKGAVTDAPDLDLVDGVPYARLATADRGYGSTPLPQYLADYAEAVIGVATRLRPAILHAASNFMNGVVANFAAAALGLPSIYEVRGLWEITRLSRQPEWGSSDQFQMLRAMETQAAMDASAVITITHALRRELVERGVPEERISVVPNSVDAERFTARPRDRELEDRLGLAGRVVIGYVGSVVDYEGLDDLLVALSLLARRGVRDFAALVVGDGEAMSKLKQLAGELDLRDRILFVGRVPHEEVESYYSLIDIVPYPRKPLPVCEMVSPIKPFEAMAMEKAVVVSDVAALAEIVTDGETGLLFPKGDVEQLSVALERLVLRPELRKELGARARAWVVRERSWSAAAQRVRELYGSLVGVPAAAKA